MLKKLEEIINQITKDTDIPQKNLIEKLESFLKLLQGVSKLPEHPKTIIEQLTDNQELNREAIRIYYSSLIETLRKFVNMMAHHWKTGHSTTQSPETITNMRQVILKELSNFLTQLEKEHAHLLRHLAELEDYSGNFEKANEFIFKVIWQDIQEGSLLDEEAMKDFAVPLANSSGNYKSRLLLLKERCSKLLKEPTFVIQKIEELEKVISQKEIIKNSSEKIRQTPTAIKKITETEPLNLESLSSKVEDLCEQMDVIGNFIEKTKEEIPIPLREINDNCLEPILKVASALPKDSEKECIGILLKINDRLLKYFSAKDSKRFMNLFDRIEYFRLHKSLWDEFRFKESIKEAYKLGNIIYENINSYSEYSDQRKLETFLGQFGEICRDMLEFKVCAPAEERNLLLKSNDLLQKSLLRDSKPMIEYYGRNYSRMGRNYINLKQWEDAIRCFKEIEYIDRTKKVDKKIAFEALAQEYRVLRQFDVVN